MLMVVIDPHFNLLFRGFNQKMKGRLDPTWIISVLLAQTTAPGFWGKTYVAACVSVLTCVSFTRIVINGLGRRHQPLGPSICAD